MPETMVLVGANRGIGAAAARHLSPRVVLMGARCANGPVGPETANAAPNFGLEGASPALRTTLQVPIPLADVLAATDFALAVSAVARRIDLAQVRAA